MYFYSRCSTPYRGNNRCQSPDNCCDISNHSSITISPNRSSDYEESDNLCSAKETQENYDIQPDISEVSCFLVNTLSILNKFIPSDINSNIVREA